ncbi:hypothetical protein D9M68_571620 [compost metagenome]
MGQVVRIHANAVAAHQARTERQEVPLGAGGLQHGLGVDAHLVEDQGQFVDQRDVHVALRVLDHFGGLGHADAGRLVRAGGDDLLVQLVDQLGHFGRGAGGDLLDRADAVFLVARVDALGAVARVEVHVELQARHALQHRHAVFFGGARIDGGFIDDDVAALEHGADRFAGLDQRRQVGLLVFVDGGRHGHDEHVGLAQFCAVCGVRQFGGFGQLGVADFQRMVVAGLQGLDAARIDIETDNRTLLAELDCKRQTDIAQADDGEFHILDSQHNSPFTVERLRHFKFDRVMDNRAPGGGRRGAQH